MDNLNTEIEIRLNLTAQEASQLIGCSKYTILELVRRGEIPSHRVGNRIKFTRGGLEKWIDAQEKKSWQRV